MTSLETRLRRLALALNLRAIQPEPGEDWKQWLDAAAAQLDRAIEQARAIERPAPVVPVVPPHWRPQRAPAPSEPGAVVLPFPRRQA